MKKYFLVLLVSLFFVTGCREKDISRKEGSSITLKMLEWNIWHGGKGERLPVKDARPVIIDILRHSGADVILMIETYGAAPMIADSLGFHYALLSSNLCVFCRYPILDTLVFPDSISPFNFGGVKVDVAGRPVIFFDTWLHYLPDTRLVPVDSSEADIIAWECRGSRDDEIRKILHTIRPCLQQADSVPVIMGGDFNSHSHLDWIEATKNMYHHGGAVVRWPVSSAMTGAGFKDAYREIHPDPVKDPGTTWLPARGENGELFYDRQDRIDYIYYRGKKVKAVAAEIFDAPDGTTFSFHGRQFMYPSDHGFVLVTFRLD